MTKEQSALLARLDTIAIDIGWGPTRLDILGDAAAMIRELVGENERLYNAIVTCPLVDVTDERDTLRAEVERLKGYEWMYKDLCK